MITGKQDRECRSLEGNANSWTFEKCMNKMLLINVLQITSKPCTTFKPHLVPLTLFLVFLTNIDSWTYLLHMPEFCFVNGCQPNLFLGVKVSHFLKIPLLENRGSNLYHMAIIEDFFHMDLIKWKKKHKSSAQYVSERQWYKMWP